MDIHSGQGDIPSEMGSTLTRNNLLQKGAFLLLLLLFLLIFFFGGGGGGGLEGLCSGK